MFICNGDKEGRRREEGGSEGWWEGDERVTRKKSERNVCVRRGGREREYVAVRTMAKERRARKNA